MLVTLEDAKKYLRVDSADDDSLIEVLLSSSCQQCVNIARLSTDKWNAINNGDDAGDYDASELKEIGEVMTVGILYALAYMYEHREEADYHALNETLKAILFSVREGAFI